MKKKGNILVSALAVLVVMLVFSMPFFGIKRHVSTISPRERVTIVLDAGHGGVDGGVVGRHTGVLERDINLLTAKTLEKQLTDAGFRVVLTRQTKYGLYEEAEGAFKREDFLKRKKIIEEANAALVISLHCNKFSDTKRRGVQVFFDGANENSKEFGRQVQAVINENVNSKYAGRNFAALAGDYYIVKCTSVPSIIVECGFLSNYEDVKLLNSEEYRAELSYHIMTGAIRYLKTK